MSMPSPEATAADLEKAIRHLAKTDKGLDAIRHILAWMTSSGLSLDGRNKNAALMVIMGTFAFPGTGCDTMREVLGDETTH